MADESVTVVLPTHRRPDGLARVLRSLAAQEDPGVPWNVVVVDNDAVPSSPKAVDDIVLPVEARMVHEPRLGSAHARNRGLAEATGSIVAFIDDDVSAEPAWLRALIAPIPAGRCTGSGGRVVLDPSVPLPRWFASWMAGYLAEYGPADQEVDLTEADLGPTLPEPYILTANAAFRTQMLRDIGGFDPLLGPRVGIPIVNDDISLSRRFIAAGGVLRYVPEARVIHELPAARLTRRYITRRCYAQGRSDWLLDRDFTSTLRFGGVRGTVTTYLRKIVETIAGNGVEKRYAFLWYDGARRLGFLREALSHSTTRTRRR